MAEPLPWIVRYLPLIRAGGLVLDLAAGSGRHTSLLREQGYEVTAVDRDISRLRQGFSGDPLCHLVETDLESGADWGLGGGYDGIVVTHYLHRPLLPALAAALAPGGALLYETFLLGQERFGKPSNPDFLLRPNELLEVYAGSLAIVAFEQGVTAGPRPAALQRLAALKGAPGALP